MRVRDEAAKTPNAKSMAAMGLTGILVPNDGFCTIPPGLVYQVPASAAGARDRWPVIFPAFTNRAGEDFYCWRAIESLPLPAEGTVAGCSIIPASAMLPVVPGARLEAITEAPPDAIYGFTCQLRRRFLPDIDRGPVTEWSKAGTDRARAVGKQYAPLFRRQRDPLRRWQLRHALELVVRGLRVRPDRALALLLAAIEELRVDAGDGVRQEIEQLALVAAQGGEVSVGSMLSSSKKGKG